MSAKGNRFFAIPSGIFGRGVKNTPAIVSSNKITSVDLSDKNNSTDLTKKRDFDMPLDDSEPTPLPAVSSEIIDLQSQFSNLNSKVENNQSSLLSTINQQLSSLEGKLQGNIKEMLDSKHEKKNKCLAISIPVTFMTKINCTVPTTSSPNHFSSKGMNDDHRLWSHELADAKDTVQCTIPIPSSYPNNGVAEISFYTLNQSGDCNIELSTTSTNSVQTLKVCSSMKVGPNNNYVQKIPLPSNVIGNYHINIKTDGSFPIYITGMCLVFE
jgi:hypothetical protein